LVNEKDKDTAHRRMISIRC